MWKRGNPWSLALLMAEGSRLDLSPCQVGRIHVLRTRTHPVCSTTRDSVATRAACQKSELSRQVLKEESGDPADLMKLEIEARALGH